MQRHPWDGNTEVGPGTRPSARLALLPHYVLLSVGVLSVRSASSRAVLTIATAAAATTATAAADEEDDDLVSVRRCGLCHSHASASPSAARTLTEVVVINDYDNDEKPCAQSTCSPRRTLLLGSIRATVLAAALALPEGSGHYAVRTSRVEMFSHFALELTAAELGENAEEEVMVAAEEAPGWLPAGVRLPAPDSH
jgi:hypothetical protein